MSHYDIRYTSADRKENDRKAIQDIAEYLGDKYHIISDMIPTDATLGSFQTAFMFAGVKGYPVHAFLRTYRPTEYREWMESGDDAIPLDDDLFPIRDEAKSEIEAGTSSNG